MAVLPKTMRPERVSKKVKPLYATPLDAGLRFVQRESNPGHHTSRPIQRLGRTTATENHKIIGVVDNLGLEYLTPSGDPPVLQKTVHIQVGEQRTDDAALRRATTASLPTTDPRFAVFIPLRNRNLQPHLDQTQHVPINYPPSHTLQQFGVWNGIKVLRQIGVHHIGVAVTK